MLPLAPVLSLSYQFLTGLGHAERTGPQPTVCQHRQLPDLKSASWVARSTPQLCSFEAASPPQKKRPVPKLRTVKRSPPPTSSKTIKNQPPSWKESMSLRNNKSNFSSKFTPFFSEMSTPETPKSSKKLPAKLLDNVRVWWQLLPKLHLCQGICLNGLQGFKDVPFCCPWICHFWKSVYYLTI